MLFYDKSKPGLWRNDIVLAFYLRELWLKFSLNYLKGGEIRGVWEIRKLLRWLRLVFVFGYLIFGLFMERMTWYLVYSAMDYVEELQTAIVVSIKKGRKRRKIQKNSE